jgi:hypothetical protein
MCFAVSRKLLIYKQLFFRRKREAEGFTAKHTPGGYFYGQAHTGGGVFTAKHMGFAVGYPG